MVILAEEKIFYKGFSESRDLTSRQIINILYNNNSKLCLNSSLLSIIEKSIENQDLFQCFIKELSDENRIESVRSDSSKTYDDQLLQILSLIKMPFYATLALDKESKIAKYDSSCVIINQYKKANRHWVMIDLLTKNICKIDHAFFETDESIKEFCDQIFKIPRSVIPIKIFNRDPETDLLLSIKGNYIEYYSLIKGDLRKRHEQLEIKKKLKQELGGKLKLFFTKNPRVLHERKIIIGNLLLTFDNALSNIKHNEPTWEIFIAYDPELAIKWCKKSDQFNELI